MREWISVKDRMPEESGDYVVYGGGKIWICKILNIFGSRGWSNDYRNPRIEAWLPLPEPPK